jgi:uncharacterized protein (TIGR04255 family)
MPIFKSEKVKKNEIPPLLNPPLIEVIFELRWELESLQPREGAPVLMRDPSYPVMYGRLYERLKKDFPITEDLPSVQAHPETAPYVPRHRMRKGKNEYPLIQVGPGIVTINETKNYSWSKFRALVEKVVSSLLDLYPEQSAPMNFMKAEVRYVNGIRFDLARENPLSFLAEKLHTKIELSPEMYILNNLSERPNGVGLNLSYVIEKPMGNLSLGINMGQFEGKPTFIQQTLIQSFGELVPSDSEGISLWLEESHTVAENCFQVLCKGELMDHFGRA